MNCCDEYGECNQGRNCPVRVAKVGQKIHGPEPLKGSIWRRQLKHLAYWMLMAFFGMVWIAALIAIARFI